MYVKHRVRPMLTDETSEFLTSAYANLRTKEDSKTLPITARTFETMIRLSEAHAKCRLSPLVTVDDARAAIDVMNYALYHEASPQQQQQQGPPRANAATAAVAAADAAVADTEIAAALAGSKRTFDQDTAAMHVDHGDVDDIPEVDIDADVDDKLTDAPPPHKRAHARGDADLDDDNDGAQRDTYVSEKRGSEFRVLVRRHFEQTQSESATAEALLASVNAMRRAEQQLLFTIDEVRLLLQMMDAESG
jgi:hypothetical protein